MTALRILTKITPGQYLATMTPLHAQLMIGGSWGTLRPLQREGTPGGPYLRALAGTHGESLRAIGEAIGGRPPKLPLSIPAMRSTPRGLHQQFKEGYQQNSFLGDLWAIN